MGPLEGSWLKQKNHQPPLESGRKGRKIIWGKRGTNNMENKRRVQRRRRRRKYV